MKTIMFRVVMLAIVCVGVLTPVLASPVSKAVVKSGEKVAADLGLRIAGKNAVRGGAKLAAVTAEREAAKRATGAVVGNAASRVTAAQLLAAGGGTAMVVAAHECADGVQQMGEGVKAAVVANPDIAKDVADSVTAPWRYVIIIGCAGLCIFIVWFAWPIASLVRNWFRFLAAKRAAATQGVNPVPNVEPLVIDVEPSSPATDRPGFTRVELVVIFAGFLLLSFLGIRSLIETEDSHEQKISNVAEEYQNELQTKVTNRAEMAAQLHSDYIAALNRHYAEFLADVDSIANEKFGFVRAKVPGVADRFGTFSRCKALLVDLVYDKFDNGNRTGDSIKRDLESDFYRGLYAAHDAVNIRLVEFLKRAEAERTAFSRKLGVELDSIELPGDEAFKEMLTNGGDRIDKSKSKLFEGQRDATISVAIEAAGIRFTISTVSRILGRAAARMAGSAVFGGGAALADGPIPVGDIIGGAVVLGSTAWCAYDIYKASDALPGELKRTLNSVVNDCEAKTISEYRKAGKELLDAYSFPDVVM